MTKILLIEDYKVLASALKTDLEACGFEVMLCYTGENSVNLFLKYLPDILLVDINLPVKNGFEIVNEIRDMHIKTPVIFISARDGVEDVVQGFKVGGNDYIRKPFDPRELVARIYALLAPTAKTKINISQLSIIRINTIEFDFVADIISQGINTCTLTPTQASIVKYLLKNKGNIVPFELIINECFKGNNDYTEFTKNSLKVLLSNLRKKLTDRGITDMRIITYRTKGICLYV